MATPKDENFQATFQVKYLLYVRGILNSSSSGASTPSLIRNTAIVSISMPNFRSIKRSALHVLPYTKYVRVMSDPLIRPVFRYDEPTANGYYDERRWETNVTSHTGAPVNIALADDPSQRAISKLLNQLSETKVNTLVTAAEMHKTADHLAKTATRLYNAYRAVKKGDFTGFTRSLGLTTTEHQKRRFNKRFAKAKSQDAQQNFYSERTMMQERTQTNVKRFAGDTWLEYSYGWKPLLYDVYGHAKALAELSIERQNVTRFVKGRGTTLAQKTKVFPGDHVQTTRSSKDARWVEYGVAYRLQGGSLNTFSQLGIDNPLEVAWEVVPLSFVVDWMWPIGDFLKSLTATTGLVFLTGYRSSRRVTNNTATITTMGPYWTGTGTAKWIYPANEQSELVIDIRRDRLESFPSPEFPPIRAPFGRGEDYGLTKALSAIALLQSLFLKR